MNDDKNKATDVEFVSFDIRNVIKKAFGIATPPPSPTTLTESKQVEAAQPVTQPDQNAIAPVQKPVSYSIRIHESKMAEARANATVEPTRSTLSDARLMRLRNYKIGKREDLIEALVAKFPGGEYADAYHAVMGVEGGKKGAGDRSIPSNILGPDEHIANEVHVGVVQNADRVTNTDHKTIPVPDMLFANAGAEENADAEDGVIEILDGGGDDDGETLSEQRNAFEANFERFRGDKNVLMLIELDHLQTVIDTIDEEAGDMAFEGVASAINENIRPNDVLSRWDRNQFIVLLTSTTYSDGVEFGEKIRAAVEVADLNGVTISIGATPSQENEEFSKILDRASCGLSIASNKKNAVAFG